MKQIETGQTRSDAQRKLFISVDDSDFVFLNHFNWQVDKNGVVSSHAVGLMSRLIMEAPRGKEVDHIDGNRFNNQRSNLRLATSSQNKCNRGPRKDNKSGLKGVSWHRPLNKWTARIKIPYGKYLHLGLFGSKIEAAKAYNGAAEKYHGEFAWLNSV